MLISVYPSKPKLYHTYTLCLTCIVRNCDFLLRVKMTAKLLWKSLFVNFMTKIWTDQFCRKIGILIKSSLPDIYNHILSTCDPKLSMLMECYCCKMMLMDENLDVKRTQIKRKIRLGLFYIQVYNCMVRKVRSKYKHPQDLAIYLLGILLSAIYDVALSTQPPQSKVQTYALDPPTQCRDPSSLFPPLMMTAGSKVKVVSLYRRSIHCCLSCDERE